MRDIFLLVVMFLSVLLIIGYIWYFIDSILNSTKGRVGYVGSSLKDCAKPLTAVIKKYVPDTSKVELIEPGAGLSHVARFLARTFTWKKVTATDLSAILLLLAHLLDIGKGIKIHYLWQNIFTSTYPKGSCIYCYLRSPLLDRLYAEGHFNGSLVICLTFSITDVEPTETIELPSWQKKIINLRFQVIKNQLQKKLVK